MKFYVRTLAVILLVAAGFVVGLRYEMQRESKIAANTTVAVQQIRIRHLQEEALKLRTALLLRDNLEAVRLKLPRATYQEMVDAIGDAAIRYDVPPETILAVIRIESNFDVNATSDSGAVGLMQLLPSTAEEVARELRLPWTGEESQLRDPSVNIRLGTHYLTKLLTRFDDLSQALAAYNEGPERVADRAPGTTDYARRVLQYAAP
ncbi:MAG TPA: lytic transglycosylase domain-containing protein [Candidatus Polarisedimenticolia bacterium]|jgi:soluble lytic murein transglycosylase-like protein|nr:lytic transglycosylase domain-containing protein [Candidatus Polarisedimenticolia bacterium]